MTETTGAPDRRAAGRVGTVINGKWHVDARIGEGGMATVYSATHRNGHRAAIKMLHPDLSRDPGSRARFLREGYVANSIGHSGVVAVIDDDVTEDGAVYLVVELLSGESLEARRLRCGGKLPLDEVLEIADQTLAALAAAHEKGIVHRDLKPENIFLTDEGRVKLLDFGLARMDDSSSIEVTQAGLMLGTPEYMPPEQAAGRRDEIDARTDIWGLGATLFTMISGANVHVSTSLREQLVAITTMRAPSLRDVTAGVPEAIVSAIDRALELEQKDRWPDARSMRHALRQAREAAPWPKSLSSVPKTLADSSSERRGVVALGGASPIMAGEADAEDPTLAGRREKATEPDQMPTLLVVPRTDPKQMETLLAVPLTDPKQMVTLPLVPTTPLAELAREAPPPEDTPIDAASPRVSEPAPPPPRKRRKVAIAMALAVLALGAAGGYYVTRVGVPSVRGWMSPAR